MTAVTSLRTNRYEKRLPAPSQDADYSGVTELPGNLAHREQLSILYTRYHWAAQYCRGKDVLEVACGAGQGLGFLRRVARRVVGGDIEERNLAFARRHYEGREGIELRRFDAVAMPFEDASFDTLIVFEAIYYFPDIGNFLAEARRILRPGGTLLVSSVNCQWHGFNPSPFSVRYYPGDELLRLANGAGFQGRLWAAFPDRADSFRSKVVARLRRAAVALRLVPKTMKGKTLLKRLFYGKLQAVPWEVDEGMAPIAPMIEATAAEDLGQYKMLYLAAAAN